MGGFNEQLEQFSVVEESSETLAAEPEEKAAEVAAQISFPLAYGMTLAQAQSIGAWWEERRSIVQPSNFVLNESGKVLSATYSSGPIGRLEAVDAIRFIQFPEKMKNS